MAGSEIPKGVRTRLAQSGFLPAGESTGGPMGSAQWRFSDGIVDIEVFNDRGDVGATAGHSDDTTFEVNTWARVLRLSVPDLPSLEEHVAFFLDHLSEIRRAIQTDALIGTKLRDANWQLVKERLGLDPDLPRPGTHR